MTKSSGHHDYKNLQLGLILFLQIKKGGKKAALMIILI
jgi:hypothetical protein